MLQPHDLVNIVRFSDSVVGSDPVKELQIGTSQIYSKTFMIKPRASENMPDKLLSYRLSNIGYIYCNGEQEDSNRKPD